MRMIGLLLMTVAVLAGCKDKKEEKLDKLKDDLKPIVEKHAAATKAVLAAIPEVGKTALAAEKVTERAPLARKFSFDPENPLNSGTLLETAKLLVDKAAKVDIHIAEDLYTKRLTQIMDGTYKGSESSAKLLEQDFTRVTAIKQIAAVRFHDVRRPRMEKDTEVEAGHARGDVLIYDAESKKLIGAFPFDATDDHPSVTTILGKKKSATKSLEHKFITAVKAAINLELAAYLDGKPGPATPGREKPADKKAEDTKAEDTKAGDTKAPDKKPDDKADAKAGDAKAGDAKAGDAKAGDAKAGDAKAPDKKAPDKKPDDKKPDDKKPDAPKPADKKPTDKPGGGW